MKSKTQFRDCATLQERWEWIESPEGQQILLNRPRIQELYRNGKLQVMIRDPHWISQLNVWLLIPENLASDGSPSPVDPHGFSPPPPIHPHPPLFGPPRHGSPHHHGPPPHGHHGPPPFGPPPHGPPFGQPPRSPPPFHPHHHHLQYPPIHAHPHPPTDYYHDHDHPPPHHHSEPHLFPPTHQQPPPPHLDHLHHHPHPPRSPPPIDHLPPFSPHFHHDHIHNHPPSSTQSLPPLQHPYPPLSPPPDHPHHLHHPLPPFHHHPPGGIPPFIPEAHAQILSYQFYSFTEAQKYDFMIHGYIVIPNAIPEPILEKALEYLQNRSVSGQANLAFQTEFSTEECIMDLFYKTPVQAMAESLFYGDKPHLPTQARQAQIAQRPPQGSIQSVFTTFGRRNTVVDGKRWHIDGLSQRNHSPFALLIGVSLSDQLTENCGNLSVFPGSHHTLLCFLKGFAAAGYLPEIAGQSDGPNAIELYENKPSLESPKQLLLKKGDVVLIHQKVAHRGENNASNQTRNMVYFRVASTKHFRAMEEGLNDLWIEYEGMSDVLHQ
mmetsp:Transcript_25680/g.28006  ORF Transcript_25680/g.28006 Transcript_25680/m.28006 type:complete len:548 (-) Transcript_25680:62-1705(-)